MNHEKSINQQRQRRRWRVGKKVRGVAGRPRLAVKRSLKHIYAQVIDDLTGKTLCAASTAEKDIRGSLKSGGNKDAAAAVGKALAERALAAGVKQVCLDRGSCKYHGRVAALADAAREGGLDF